MSLLESEAKSNQHKLIVRTIFNDVETPVSAFLKLGKDKPYAFCLSLSKAVIVRGVIP